MRTMSSLQPACCTDAGTCVVSPASTGRLTPPSLMGLLVHRVHRMLEARRQRRALLALDDRLLQDVGLTREDVEGHTGIPLRE